MGGGRHPVQRLVVFGAVLVCAAALAGCRSCPRGPAAGETAAPAVAPPVGEYDRSSGRLTDTLTLQRDGEFALRLGIPGSYSELAGRWAVRGDWIVLCVRRIRHGEYAGRDVMLPESGSIVMLRTADGLIPVSEDGRATADDLRAPYRRRE